MTYIDPILTAAINRLDFADLYELRRGLILSDCDIRAFKDALDDRQEELRQQARQELRQWEAEQAKPIAVTPILSDTTDWCAGSPVHHPFALSCKGLALADSGYDNYGSPQFCLHGQTIYDGKHEYALMEGVK